MLGTYRAWVPHAMQPRQTPAQAISSREATTSSKRFSTHRAMHMWAMVRRLQAEGLTRRTAPLPSAHNSLSVNNLESEKFEDLVCDGFFHMHFCCVLFEIRTHNVWIDVFDGDDEVG